jgi:hypothetical protein
MIKMCGGLGIVKSRGWCRLGNLGSAWSVRSKACDIPKESGYIETRSDRSAGLIGDSVSVLARVVGQAQRPVDQRVAVKEAQALWRKVALYSPILNLDIRFRRVIHDNTYCIHPILQNHD